MDCSEKEGPLPQIQGTEAGRRYRLELVQMNGSNNSRCVFQGGFIPHIYTALQMTGGRMNAREGGG